MVSIEIIRNGQVIARTQGAQEASLLYEGSYQAGDQILFQADGDHAVVQVDQQLMPARVYLPRGRFTFRPPLEGDGLAVYPPGAFTGEGHLLFIRPDGDNAWRNLACNPADQRGATDPYPPIHTRRQTWKREMKAFCGVQRARRPAYRRGGHGQWPYGSWGIGARTDAELTLDFGRVVEIDALSLYLRADFPHDAYWIEATVTLDDGHEQTFSLEGRDGAQRIALGKHRVRRLRLHRLIKCDDPSAFPALRQIEVFGRDIESGSTDEPIREE